MNSREREKYPNYIIQAEFSGEFYQFLTSEEYLPPPTPRGFSPSFMFIFR